MRVIRKSGHGPISLSPPFLHLLHSLRIFLGTGISEYLLFHAIILVSLKPTLKIVGVLLLRHVVSLYTMLLLPNPVTIKVYCTWLLLLIIRQLFLEYVLAKKHDRGSISKHGDSQKRHTENKRWIR